MPFGRRRLVYYKSWLDNEMDEEHFSTFLPEPVSPLLDSDPMVERKSKKREIFAVTTLTSIPKKLRSPEIASVDEVFAGRQ